MKYLKQALIILVFTLAGELLAAVIPLPIPAAIYGFILLFAALCAGALKPAQLRQTADFLISLMPLLFIAPAAGLLEQFGIIAPKLLSILTVTVASTFLVLAVAGLVTQLLCRGKERQNG